jgi:hypothetical protein
MENQLHIGQQIYFGCEQPPALKKVRPGELFAAIPND